MCTMMIGLRTITVTFRIAVVFVSITLGAAAACVAWWHSSGIMLAWVEDRYPKVGELGMPSDEVVLIACASLFLYLPIAIVIGVCLGAVLAGRLVFPKSASKSG